ncbi:hypothetical protein ACX27_26685 [Nostoc piscinale CENA21]|uniref:Gp5/Type VI secretion system Vgr protein OB-fold domain-containing protein n=1 Tax=Nostoc piscinale CENA21 TaxID=224013 RepID=A0A0M4T7Z4_9NOSO|nr:phage baseplate assembly protein V [Nostoc piscinale]ALF55616.1 hypothetical protein ACX27_26685 [Nostoc piscinale CENA21]
MSIFEILARSERANQFAIDQQGRSPYPTLGIVVENNDPEGRRRIKVALPSNPQVQSDWIRRLTPFPQFDPPLPEIGQTVLVFYADGLETNGYYLQLVNDTNPALAKDSALNDHATAVNGTRTTTIGGDDTTTVSGSSTLQASEDISNECDGDFSVDAGQDILMEGLRDLKLIASRYLRIQVSPSNYIELSFDGTNRVGGAWTINLSGSSINFINASSSAITINGKAVAVVGAAVSGGGTVVTSGY